MPINIRKKNDIICLFVFRLQTAVSNKNRDAGVPSIWERTGQ